MKKRPPVPPDRPPAPALSDEDLWARAMSDVRPIGERRAPPPRRPPPGEPAEAAGKVPGDDREFAELLKSAGGFDIEERGETIRGRVPDLPVDTLRRLAGGGFAVDERLDLHGRTLVETERFLPAFISGARVQGARVVLVVHGRGGGSPGRDAVLRRFVREWLVSSAARAHVLAFASATPRDGGAGGVYVLLRR